MATEHRAWVLAVRHPTRMAILEALASGMKVSPQAFAELRKLPPATVGYHFMILDDVGAIESTSGEFKITERGLMLRNLAQSSD
jgi:DNA-binding transcriptional ArsR family regulator